MAFLDSPFHPSGHRPRLGLRSLEAHPQTHFFAKLMNVSVLSVSVFSFLNRDMNSMKNPSNHT